MIVVWFSCGAASAVAAKYAVQMFPDVRVVNTFVAEEYEDNRRFLRDVERWIGQPIESAVSRKYPNGSCEEVWRRERYMSGVKGAKCTVEIKKKARQQWQEVHNPAHHILGFTYDEKARHDRFVRTELDNVIPILIDLKISKQDCVDILTRNGLLLPVSYRKGYPNANCPGCVRASSPTYWNFVRRVDPLVFRQRAVTSRDLGCKLVRYRGERIYLDELPEDAVGAPMKSLALECGVFCEESA